MLIDFRVSHVPLLYSSSRWRHRNTRDVRANKLCPTKKPTLYPSGYHHPTPSLHRQPSHKLECFFPCTAILSVLNSTNELDIGAEQLMMTRHPLKELLFYLTCLKFVSVQKKTIGNVSCSRHGLINQQPSKAKCSFHLPHSDQLWQTHFTCMYM